MKEALACTGHRAHLQIEVLVWMWTTDTSESSLLAHVLFFPLCLIIVQHNRGVGARCTCSNGVLQRKSEMVK